LGSSVAVVSSLKNSSMTSCSFACSRGSGATYFFRIGVIYWGEKTEEKRVKEWGAGWDHNSRYLSDSTIEKISGGTMVTF